MTITQTPAPSELAVTAHATLAQPLITISGLSWSSHHERQPRSVSSS